MKILLLEDDEGIALLTKEALEKEGFDVDVACNGAEGFKKARDQKYDIYILDQLLPDGTGLEVFEKLKAILPHIVAVMITGSGDEHIAVAAMKMGVSDYIVKAADMGYLATLPLVIKKALEQRFSTFERERLTEELAKRNKELKERNEELAAKLKMLQTFEKTTVDREKRISELKEEIRRLREVNNRTKEGPEPKGRQVPQK